jgi:hypothetical protein
MNCRWIIGLLMVCAPSLAAGQQSVTPSSPAQSASEGVLQDGMPIKLQLLHKLDSHMAKGGDKIEFEVVNDMVVNGVIVLRRGAPATGLITASQASRTMGRAGRLTFTIDEIRLSNGEKVPVRAYNRTSGENRTGEMVYLMLNTPMAVAPFFLLMHGTNTVFPRGTQIAAFVNGDIHLKFDNSGKTP